MCMHMSSLSAIMTHGAEIPTVLRGSLLGANSGPLQELKGGGAICLFSPSVLTLKFILYWSLLFLITLAAFPGLSGHLRPVAVKGQCSSETSTPLSLSPLAYLAPWDLAHWLGGDSFTLSPYLGPYKVHRSRRRWRARTYGCCPTSPMPSISWTGQTNAIFWAWWI